MTKLKYTFKSELPRTIVISIINFNLFNRVDLHSEFQPLEVTRHTQLSDKMSLHFFELKKVPKNISKDNMLLLWLSLFKAQTEEELAEIESLEVPEMTQAIGAYRQITVTPEFLEIERLREKARHDEAQALHHAMLVGKAEGRAEGILVGIAEGKAEGKMEGLAEGEKAKALDIALKALNKNMSVNDIIDLTGLTQEEIENLRGAN